MSRRATAKWSRLRPDMLEVKLARPHLMLLRSMLEQHIVRLNKLRPKGYSDEVRWARLIASTTPKLAPYHSIDITGPEWEIISRALRPNGTKPRKGTPEMAAYGLYLKLSHLGCARFAKWGPECEPPP